MSMIQRNVYSIYLERGNTCVLDHLKINSEVLVQKNYPIMQSEETVYEKGK